MTDEPTMTVEGRPKPDSAGTSVGLEVVDGRTAAPPTPLAPGVTVLGRADDADLQLLGDGVSRRHVKLVARKGDEVQLIDLGSHNGTFVNGVKVEVGVLQIGDEFRIGTMTLRLVPVGTDDPTPAGASDPSVSTSTTAAAALTSRELEVARWVAQGLTNAEVGAKLFISPRTVGRHLGNIYARLGIHSRAALAKAIGELDARSES